MGNFLDLDELEDERKSYQAMVDSGKNEAPSAVKIQPRQEESG